MENNNKKLLYRRMGDSDGTHWYHAGGIDEMRNVGSFIVQLRHGSAECGLPLPACADEHYIVATLIVTESGTDDKLQKNRLVGHTLILPQCSDGTMRIYTRVLSKSGGTEKWGAWSSVVTTEELNSHIDTAVDVVWTANSNINHYTTAGTYNITGERLNANDGLPIANSNPGHTIHARLSVLDSSIAGTGDSHDKCVTQVLALSNRTGGDGDVYIRTGRASIKNQLAGGTGWEPWSKLQQNIEVGQVTSLDSFTGNGIYSGVYTNGSTFFETFVMVVINNYVVAGATGQVRSISQFKYALNVDGTFSYKTRTGQGSSVIVWGSWVDLGAADTTDIQDGAITAQKLSSDVREKVEKVPSLVENATKEKTALVNGDTIVGLAREVYSRQGKTDTATFLKRTTAGGTSISDGVASVKQIGGNIVKNLIDGNFENVIVSNGTATNKHGVCLLTSLSTSSYCALVYKNVTEFTGHIYYTLITCLNTNAGSVRLSLDGGFTDTVVTNRMQWINISRLSVKNENSSTVSVRAYPEDQTLPQVFFKKWCVIDLTEMFGAGNEPTKDECDRMFGAMDALPQGLTVAQPTGLKSVGYNQWNPENVLNNKSIVENAIEDDVPNSHIAIIECLPCKTGAGENNGYVIGYGEGDTWSDEGIEVYLTPLNPMDYIGQDVDFYMHKLDKDETYGTYVPQIKGYLLVVTPTTDKLCANFHWSGDREVTDYEPYVESNVTLPVIPEMSEWGLAGIQTSGTMAQDTIDLEKMVYIKRVECVDLGDMEQWSSFDTTTDTGETYRMFAITDLQGIAHPSIYGQRGNALCAELSNVVALGVKVYMQDLSFRLYTNGVLYMRFDSCSTTDELKNALKGKTLYFELAAPEEYPIVTKTAPNYIGSDYGVEEFTDSKVPLAANILFYMRSLVSETRNFLDRLMAGLGTSDATAVADKIIAAVNQHSEVSETETIENE